MVLKRYQPYLAMLFIQILYAGMALFSKASISNGMNPYVFVVYRQAFATLSLAPFAIFLERSSNFSHSLCIYIERSSYIHFESQANMFVIYMCSLIHSSKATSLSFTLLVKIFVISLFGYGSIPILLVYICMHVVYMK